MITLPLQYKAKVNIITFDGKTALSYAIENKHGDITTLLRNAGAKH